MGWLDMFNPKVAEPVAAAVPVVTELRGALDARVHHEYFASEEPENGRYPWLARVYAADGTAHQNTGMEESYQDARREAFAWCERTKDTMREAV